MAARRAVELAPQQALVHYNLGNALYDQKSFDDAITSYRRAVELGPQLGPAHNNLAIALGQAGRNEDALASFERARALNPFDANVMNNLCGVLTDLGRLAEAITYGREAVALAPNHPQYCFNLANALHDSGSFADADAVYRRAIELQPNFTAAMNNLGVCLRHRGVLTEAVAFFERAIALDPGYAEPHNNLGQALLDQSAPDAALAAFRRAITLKPDYFQAHSNVVSAMTHSLVADARGIYEEARRWNQRHAEPLARFIRPHDNDRNPDRRLRVGYVSPDFHVHPIAYFMEGLLREHDREQVEVVCYSTYHQTDDATARLKRHADVWRDINAMPDDRFAELIRQDRVDILVDLAGHTARHRLLVFARKPAPVQVTHLGYCGTTGLSAIDYRLTDPHADPPGGGSDAFYSEQLVRLPDTFACFSPADSAPPVVPRTADANGDVTFASFHKLAKLNDTLLGWWAQILRQVPRSRLTMRATGSEDAAMRERITGVFAANGVAGDRLELAPPQHPIEAFLKLHERVDVSLDTFPWSGHTVACHAAWMGVPTVTLAGDDHRSRMVASLLMNLGLPELIARTPDEFVNIAATLANDAARRAELRATLRQRMASSPITDAARFARNVETAYRRMWRAWCAK